MCTGSNGVKLLLQYGNRLCDSTFCRYFNVRLLRELSMKDNSTNSTNLTLQLIRILSYYLYTGCALHHDGFRT